MDLHRFMILVFISSCVLFFADAQLSAKAPSPIPELSNKQVSYQEFHNANERFPETMMLVMQQTSEFVEMTMKDKINVARVESKDREILVNCKNIYEKTLAELKAQTFYLDHYDYKAINVTLPNTKTCDDLYSKNGVDQYPELKKFSDLFIKDLEEMIYDLAIIKKHHQQVEENMFALAADSLVDIGDEEE